MCNLCCLWNPKMCHILRQIPINCNLKHLRWTHTFRTCLSKIPFNNILPPFPVATQSKAWVYGRSLAGIVSSNPAGRMDVLFLVSVECCQVEVSASGWSLVQRSPPDCGVSECDHESSTMERQCPTGGLLHHGKKILPVTKILLHLGIYN